MDERGSSLRESAERLALAAMGAVALTAERAEALAERLAERGGITRDEAREEIDEMVHRWRGDARRLGERTGATLESLFRDLGLVSRRDFEELELRVAQLEHRLRLVEGPRAVPSADS